MSINLAALDTMMSDAVRHFWNARQDAASQQKKRGGSDQGNRAGVTAGKNMDGFVRMIKQIIADNGVPDADIYTAGRTALTVPGFFRPTKNWDLLVVSHGQLIAAIEFKSQVGPSFGNNFNNRVEEALGNAADIATAYREGGFGQSMKPFVGYFFVLEQCEKSMIPVRFFSPHFPARVEFNDTSYAQRYDLLCRKLVLEQFYDAATLVMTDAQTSKQGQYNSLTQRTSVERFVTVLASKVAAFAAENG